VFKISLERLPQIIVQVFMMKYPYHNTVVKCILNVAFFRYYLPGRNTLATMMTEKQWNVRKSRINSRAAQLGHYSMTAGPALLKRAVTVHYIDNE